MKTSYIFIPENAFENVLEMEAILSRPQGVNSLSPILLHFMDNNCQWIYSWGRMYRASCVISLIKLNFEPQIRILQNKIQICLTKSKFVDEIEFFLFCWTEVKPLNLIDKWKICNLYVDHHGHIVKNITTV